MQDDRFFQRNQVENHLATIFDDLPGFIYFVKDRDLRYVAWNDRLCEIFETKNILHKRDDDFIPAHILKHIRDDDLRILDTGNPVINRVELVPRGSGFVDWSTTTKKPLLHQKGELGTAPSLLHQNYRDNIPITELAQAANLSLSSFLRKFKATFNMTPKEYLRHLRVQEATHLIVQTTQTFAQISHHCGFADQAHFSREFSRILKELPKSYRARFFPLVEGIRNCLTEPSGGAGGFAISGGGVVGAVDEF